MTNTLAIFAPQVGSLSETFIRRHMTDLLPNNTVVVTNNVTGPHTGHWSVNCPVLAFDSMEALRFRWQVVRAVAQKLGSRLENPRNTAVKRFLREHQVRVIMGEYLDYSLLWLAVAREMGIRFFGHAHGYDVSENLRSAKWQEEYRRYNQADGIITISKVSRTRLLNLGLDPAKIHVIPCGVDVPAKPFLRPEHQTIRCVAVGNMVGKKGPILTLDAFRRAAEVLPNLKLEYVGRGELLPAVRQFVRAFNLEDRVTLHGGQPVESVHRLMTNADVFLQHSMIDSLTGDEEGLPVAILEAMARSLPVVSTRHAGIPEAVAEGITGYLVDEGDSEGMAERLITLARDPDLRQRLGTAGWRRAKDHFSAEREKIELVKVLGLGEPASR